MPDQCGPSRTRADHVHSGQLLMFPKPRPGVGVSLHQSRVAYVAEKDGNPILWPVNIAYLSLLAVSTATVTRGSKTEFHLRSIAARPLIR